MFVDEFIEATKSRPTSTIFCKWACISFISSLLERKVWVELSGGRKYANMYILLIAEPGVGKSQAMAGVRSVFREIIEGDDTTPGLIQLAPVSITPASLVDALEETKRKFVINDNAHSYSSLLIMNSEFATIAGQWDAGLINMLTDLYDCEFNYSERRRTNKINIEIKNPQLSMLACAVPTYLSQTMPSQAWEQGFMSRTMVIYSGERQKIDLFKPSSRNKKLENKLLKDALTISNYKGCIGFSKEAIDFIQSWTDEDMAPVPEDLRLANYNTRRPIHYIKLCMVACVQRLPEELCVTLEDAKLAQEWLLESEDNFKYLFMKLVDDTKAAIVLRIYTDIYINAMRNEQSRVTQTWVYQMVGRRVPPNEIQQVVGALEKMKYISTTMEDGVRYYMPLKKPEEVN